MKKNKDKDDNFLLYIPNKKHQDWQIINNRVCLLFYHDGLIERIIRWLFKKPRTSDLELDDTGSKVWMLIDGNNTIYDIAKKLNEGFGEDIEAVYNRLIIYIRILNKRGLIFFKKQSE